MSTLPVVPEPDPDLDRGQWRLPCQDDNGKEAEAAAAQYQARGHKQLYYVERA